MVSVTLRLAAATLAVATTAMADSVSMVLNYYSDQYCGDYITSVNLMESDTSAFHPNCWAYDVPSAGSFNIADCNEPSCQIYWHANSECNDQFGWTLTVDQGVQQYTTSGGANCYNTGTTRVEPTYFQGYTFSFPQ